MADRMIEAKVCCFTGHRNVPFSDMRRLPKLLEMLLTEQINGGVRIFKAGGALGFDTVAALSVLDLKRKKYPEISLELCLPCRDQAKKWGDRDKKTYEYIIANCDRVSYAREVYTRGCMFERNHSLVNGSDVCIAYYNGSSGGTGYTVDYAEKMNVAVLNTYDILNEKKGFFGF